MYGYLISHEWQIEKQAARAGKLSAELFAIMEEAERIKALPGWESPAADAQRQKIESILSSGRTLASELDSISSSLYYFTATHKTWLEEIEDILD